MSVPPPPTLLARRPKTEKGAVRYVLKPTSNVKALAYVICVSRATRRRWRAERAQQGAERDALPCVIVDGRLRERSDREEELATLLTAASAAATKF